MGNTVMSNKPVLYLDVDGVLIQFREDRTRLHYQMHKGGFPAERVGDFIRWANANFEVRWLTSWAMCGAMRPVVKTQLEAILWESVPNWVNPKGWRSGEKVDGIDFDDPRPWFWLDDETKRDRPLLPEQFRNNLIKTNSSVDPKALLRSALAIWGLLSGTEYEPSFPAWANDYDSATEQYRLYE